jgi:citronellol/citronellal dehydrogenase
VPGTDGLARPYDRAVNPAAASEIFAPGLLAGRVALVTGGGTGLGRATALELARCGAHVTVVGRREEPLRETVLAIDLLRGGDGDGSGAGGAEAGAVGPDVAHAGGPRVPAANGDPACAHWLAGDIRDRSEAQRLVAAAIDRWGRLDILINNAGGQYFTPAEGIVAKGWSAVWRLNVDGILFMSDAAIRGRARARVRMRDGEAQGLEGQGWEAVGREGQGWEGQGRAGEGVGNSAGRAVGERSGLGDAGGALAAALRIVNVTLSPHHGMPGMAHSGSARAAVEALTRELAARHANSGVSACAVAAGHFDTEAMGKYPDVVRAGMARSVPLQRLGAVDEHAWLVALLASPLGAAFAGSTVTLDGARDNWFGPWPPPGLAGDHGEVPTEARRGAGSAS